MIQIPKHPNEETRLIAAKRTAQQLIDDAGVEGSVEEIAADVAKHCRYGDGFQMAKDLERACWDCDMRIAEVLDYHSTNLDQAHNEFLAAFQKEHAIEPPLPVGTPVKTRRGSGIIDKIYEHRPMTYAVKMDDEAQAASPTNRRTLLFFDEVEPA